MQVDKRALVAVAALALVGVAVGATGGPTADVTAQVNVTMGIELEDQTSNGSAVEVARANLSEGGYVAIYDNTGRFLGVSEYLENGTSTDVTVNLTGELPADGSTTLVAVAHRDTDADRIFSYVLTNGDQDVPYVRNGFVMDTAEVSLEGVEETPTPTPEEETPEEETPEVTPTPTPEEETPEEETPEEETPEEETPEVTPTPTPEEETPEEETPEVTPTPVPGEETPEAATPEEGTPGE